MKLTACIKDIYQIEDENQIRFADSRVDELYLYMTQGPSYLFEKFMICFVSLYIYDLLCVVVYIFTNYINSTKNVA